MLLKVFHRTLEFNLLLSVSLITASFFGFFNKSYYFVSGSIKRHSLNSPLFELFLEPIALFDRCEKFIRKPRWFLHRFNSDWFKWSVSSTTSSTRASQVDNISSGSKVSRTVQGTSFKSLMRLLTFNFFKGRYGTVKCAFLVDFKFAFCLRTKIVGLWSLSPKAGDVILKTCSGWEQ